MKAKIKQNKLQSGRSITVELLKPCRINGKPTHKFVFSQTLKTRLWIFGKLTKTAKKKLYSFWDGLEFFLQDELPATRNRIIAQVEAVIPRLSPDDYAAVKAASVRYAEANAKANDEWLQGAEAARLYREYDIDVRRG